MATQERIRAWFLIQAPEAQISTVRAQLRKLDQAAGDSIVVVRIDQVTDETYSLVAPIEVEGDDRLNDVIDTLNDLGLSHHHLIVSGHDPVIPHLAEGFITSDEYDNDTEHTGKGFYQHNKDLPYFNVLVTPGRQVHSPGFTPWG